MDCTLGSPLLWEAPSLSVSSVKMSGQNLLPKVAKVKRFVYKQIYLLSWLEFCMIAFVCPSHSVSVGFVFFYLVPHSLPKADPTRVNKVSGGVGFL